jgi:hypothetical protein
MSSQYVVAVGAEDDWRVRASGCDEGINTFPQGGGTWKASENWIGIGNAGRGRFFLMEGGRPGATMRLCSNGDIGIGTKAPANVVAA